MLTVTQTLTTYASQSAFFLLRFFHSQLIVFQFNNYTKLRNLDYSKFLQWPTVLQLMDVLRASMCAVEISQTSEQQTKKRRLPPGPVFFSLKCSLFHNSKLFGSCIIHILYTECAKI